MDQLWYQCECCDAAGQEIEEIPHDNDCPVTQPDDVPLPLTESSEDQIMNIVYRLSDLFESGRLEQTDAAVERVTDWDGVRWAATGSTSRFVMGFGRTNNRGKFHREDKRPVVMKFDPFVRFGDALTPVSGNIDELLTWEKAVQTGTDIFFADILATARDGLWELMEECLPVYPRHRSLMRNQDAVWDNQHEEYIDPLRSALKVHGWEQPDWKHGNIGIPHGRNNAVMIDYGTGPTFDPEVIVEEQVHDRVVERAGGEFPPKDVL